MPPTFRSSRSGRHLGEATAARTRTGQIDHDVFEGLPVRRWTRQHQTISQAPKPDEAESIFQGPGGKQTLPEHPMPRDSQLLTPTSKALLRAARAGCIYIRQAPKEAEDINLIINEEKEAADTEESGAAAAGQPKAERSFVTRKWMTVPRQMEPPEVEFLAKRRPGLPSLYGAAATGVDGAPNVPMRRTRFKKVDPATGNVSVYEAWVPEGHRIEGEIAADDQVLPGNAEATVNSEAPAPGTVVEGVGTVNGEGVVVAEAGSAAVMTPPKRRPPPPKRKGKGFKGRRKKVMFAPGEGADASAVHGAGAGAGEGAMDTDGVKSEDGDASRGDQGGHEDEDDDGEEGEESDEGDESMMDAKTPETPAAELVQPTQTPQPAPAETAPEPQVPSDVSRAAEQAPAPISDKPSDEKPVPEDVTMTDYQPEPSTSEPQPAPAREATEDQPQAEQPAPPSPEESPEKPQETVKTEPDQQENQDVMDTSADHPLEQQQPQEQEPAPKPEPEQQEHNTAATENQYVDVLGTLEKNLDAPPSNEQTEPQTKPEPEPEPESTQADDSTKPVARAPASEPKSALAATAETGTSERQPLTDNQEVEKAAEEQPQPQQEQEQQPKEEEEEEEVEDQPPVQHSIEQPQEQEQQQQPEGEQQPMETPVVEPTEPTEQPTEQPAEKSTEQPAKQPAEEPKEEPKEDVEPHPQQQADEAQQQQEQEQQEQQPAAAQAQEGESDQN